MIVKSDHVEDFNTIFEIINDASIAYKGIIPKDRWKEPYMSKEELMVQIEEGVEFWSYVENGKILGVMGIQFKSDVTLIRHAYVRTMARKKGIGGKLLSHLIEITDFPVLIGTWADASWAISFYEKHKFRIVSKNEKNNLLKTYWSVPDRQIETSVVLASSDWF
ncbi:Acetyltransferase (GNAT) domain-containing protein [Tenacibaculum sp. MAR_2009_124]|uniref:GNAT family N-acetyltransferase n=1 Tax=Tenacibaculum sp. MAR_2009_124 TaxID=1250059 RepID=UPI00089BD8D5|nr:GNAT family N-acetyltransferase [Tenacibaculum sp. MAR_2009_124]SEB76474.1 Acetyltransferase (GNAT) domain-containing protein [Tenacibaculum sp. MAR_2009_124]